MPTAVNSSQFRTVRRFRSSGKGAIGTAITDPRRHALRSGTPGSPLGGPRRLQDNATGRALAAQLPLTLSFRDHNNAEKTAPLPRELPLDGPPEGHDPTAGDIGYWAPDADFVLYYDEDAPYFDGIVRIGEFDGDQEAIALLPEGADVTIERAE